MAADETRGSLPDGFAAWPRDYQRPVVSLSSGALSPAASKRLASIYPMVYSVARKRTPVWVKNAGWAYEQTYAACLHGGIVAARKWRKRFGVPLPKYAVMVIDRFALRHWTTHAVRLEAMRLFGGAGPDDPNRGMHAYLGGSQWAYEPGDPAPTNRLLTVMQACFPRELRAASLYYGLDGKAILCDKKVGQKMNTGRETARKLRKAFLAHARRLHDEHFDALGY